MYQNLQQQDDSNFSAEMEGDVGDELEPQHEEKQDQDCEAFQDVI